MHLADTEFATATGQLRALETHLLTQTIVERMVDAKDAADALRLFNELDYAQFMNDVTKPIDFQKALNADLKATKALLDGICPSEEVLRYLWIPFDIHNTKLMLKGHLGKTDYEQTGKHILPLGNIPVEQLHTFIYEGVNDAFALPCECEDAMIKGAINTAKAKFEATQDPQHIDLVLDTAMFDFLSKMAEKIAHPFVAELTTARIDLYNISFLLRVHKKENAEELIDRAFAKDGTFSAKEFKKLAHHSKEEVKKALAGSRYGKLVAIATEEDSLFNFEIGAANFIAEHFKPAKFVPYGVEPVLSYFFAKENNALIIRTIMVAKMSGIEPADIKKRLRILFN